VKVECLHTLGEVAILRTQINELNARSARPDPFSTFEYYEAVLNSDPGFQTGGQSSLWFLVAYRGDAPIGVLALKRTASKVLWRRCFTLDFLVGHDTDRPHVVATDSNYSAVIEAFYLYLRGRPDWDLLELQQQAPDSCWPRYLDSAPMRGMWRKSWPTMQNHTIRLRWNSIADYADALSKRVRSETRRQLRRLLALGELRLLSSTDPSSTGALFELYCMLERHSWKALTPLSVDSDASRAALTIGLLGAQPTLETEIHILLLDNAPIAGLINLSLSGSSRESYALQVAFDARYATYSPGSAMLLLGIRSAIEARFEAYNLLSGFGYYKSKLLADATATQSIQLYRGVSPLLWRRLLGDARRRLLRRKVEERGIAVRDGMLNEAGMEDGTRNPEERARAGVLIGRALQGRCEYLTTDELAALMPLGVTAGKGGNATAVQSSGRQMASVTTC
jgi:hypothetical protein